jgi:hypothetical protein
MDPDGIEGFCHVEEYCASGITGLHSGIYKLTTPGDVQD